MKKGLHKYQTIFVDVDGTIILWSKAHPGKAFSGSPRINTKLVDFLKTAKEENPNVKIYVWSTGGQDHANWAVDYADLNDAVEYCMAKPRLMIDDSFTWLKKRARMRPDLGLVAAGEE